MKTNQIRCFVGCERDGGEASVPVRQAVRQAQDADACLHWSVNKMNPHFLRSMHAYLQ
jgi:hypothetical protein